jgi:MORN repeat
MRVAMRRSILWGVCVLGLVLPASAPAQRPDEAPASQVLLDAYFTNSVAVSGALYNGTDQLGQRRRHFDPDRDEKVVFLTVFEARASAKVRGELIRPNGQRHGVFRYEMNARNEGTWHAKSWGWAMNGLSFYQGEWQLNLWVDDQPMGRYYFMLGKQPASVVAGWMEDLRTGCRLWNEVPQPDETVTWSGACGSDGVATGFGIREFRYGGKVSRYEGELVNGRMHGSGVRTWPNGTRHEGRPSR